MDLVMHHDTSHLERALLLTVCVLRADGEVTAEERELFELTVESLGAPSEMIERHRRMMEGVDLLDPEAAATKAGSGIGWSAAAELTRTAYLMAYADGSLDSSEVDVIDRFLRATGVPDHALPGIHQWGRLGVHHMQLASTLFATDQSPP
jgi:tellurite resistance protein